MTFRLASSATAVLALLATPALAEMRLTSPDLAEGGPLGSDQVMAGFDCERGNLSPALAWEGAPEGTRSFVVTAYDPDAPTGSGLWHWSVFNLPVTTTSLPKGAGVEGGAELPAGTRAGSQRPQPERLCRRLSARRRGPAPLRVHCLRHP